MIVIKTLVISSQPYAQWLAESLSFIENHQIDKIAIAAIDKTNGDEHFSDGVRYPMEFLYPVGKGKVTVAKGGTF